MSRITQTDLKNQRIFERYEEVIEETENAGLLPKSYFYDILANEFFCSREHIGKVVTKVMKSKRFTNEARRSK